MSIAGFFVKKTAAEFQKQVELDAAKSTQTAAQARQSLGSLLRGAHPPSPLPTRGLLSHRLRRYSAG